MKRNFFEILILEPKEKDALTNETVLKEFQEVVDTVVAEKGTLDVKFRKSIDQNNSDRLLFAAAWETIEDHDQLDVEGIVPRLLKVLLGHCNMVAAQFMFMDSSKVDFEAPVWTVDAFHVKEEEKSFFQKELDTGNGLVGAWYITKKMPPLPRVMPTDPVELMILKEGAKTAKARLKAPNPNIWMSISSSASGEVGQFGEKIKEYVQEIRSGQYEKFISRKV